MGVDYAIEPGGAFVDPFGGVGEEEFYAEVEEAFYVGFSADGAGGSAGGDDALVGVIHGFYDVGVVDVAFVSHGCGEVAGGYEVDVDVVDGEDFVEVFVGDDVFDEDYEQGVVVGDVHVVGDA